MFLAWNEIRKNKFRYILISGVLMLIAYLVFFLSGLANGLENMNRDAIDKWKATGIILTKESDKSLPQSSMYLDEAKKLKGVENAIIGQLNTIARNEKVKANVSIFGIERDSFLQPKIIEGEMYSKVYEVVASESLKNDGFSLGDQLQLSATDKVLTIVGFTSQSRFNASPVVYTRLDTLQQVKYGGAYSENQDRINGIVIRTSDLSSVKTSPELEVVEIESFIEHLPGYTEQGLTLQIMIYFLFVISAVIVAIFLYVLTVQKKSMFGVMKAQGISNRFLAQSVVVQTFLVTAIGVVLGFVLTVVTGMFLPNAVPVSFDYITMILYGVILIAVAILGAIFSVVSIVKIDPLKAIGG